MSPDLEVVKSLHPSCVIGPNSLIDDLRPKYAGIAVACMFLDLRSVEGMYASISAMGAKFDRREQAAALVAEYDAFMADYRASIEGKPQRACWCSWACPAATSWPRKTATPAAWWRWRAGKTCMPVPTKSS